MFALLDCLREINEDILAHVQTDQLSEAGHRSGHLTQLVVSQAQVLQSVAVEQRSEEIELDIRERERERERVRGGIGYLGRSRMLLQSSLRISRVLS